MTSMSEHWNNEAAIDPRYQAGMWGMGLEGKDDPQGTVNKILDELTRGLPHSDAATFCGRVAEIGCGPGRLLLPFAARFEWARFLGIDVSQEMLSLATVANLYDWGLPNLWLRMDYEPDFHYGVHDIVYMVEVVQHLDDLQLDRAIGTAHDLLHQGGELIMQYVDNGRPAEPFSHPRTKARMMHFLSEEWSTIAFRPAAELHPEWHWVRAVKV